MYVTILLRPVEYINTKFIHYLAVIENMADDLVNHTGSCHCGAVRFEVLAPKVLKVYDCKYVFLNNIYYRPM